MPYITTDPSDFNGRHAGLAGHVYTTAVITSALMSRFPPIDPALTPKNPEPLTGDPYRDIGRRCARFVELWDHVDEPDQFANSWGYTIFRTDYSSEERFAKAVKLLTAYPDHWLFEDLSLGKHWRLFNLTPRTLEWYMRSGADCLMWLWMIQLQLPEQPSEVQAPDIYYVWVKVIMNEVRNGRRRWLRMGVYDVLWENWLRVADQDIIYDEMVAVYDKEGVCNLYGPPTPFPGTTPLPPDYVYSPPRDERPGYPARTLCDIPYERLKP